MRPLPKKIRLASLILLLLLFFAVGPIILSYSLGYRFSDTFDFVKTGGIYVHSNISNTEIYVNGEYFKNNGVLLRNTLIQNLIPGEGYKVEVYKDGYHGWVKTLTVKESLVTEGRVVMLPVEIEKRAIYPYLDDAGLGTTTKPLATTTKIATNGAPSQSVENPEYEVMEYLFEIKIATTTEPTIMDAVKETVGLNAATTTEESLPQYWIDLGVDDPTMLDNLIESRQELSWLENGNIVLHWIGDENDNIPYYYCLTEECREEISLDWNGAVKKFAYLPGRGDVWVVLSNDGVWAVEVDDRSERNIQPIYVGEDLDFAIAPNNRIVVLDGGIFYEMNF